MKRWWPPDLVTGHLKDLGKIIEVRTAGLPPQQREDVARRTIIEILATRPEVPLTGMLRRHVALELERLWIPQKERNKINRQRALQHTESLIQLAKVSRKNKLWLKAGKPPPQLTTIEAVANATGKEPDALKQWLKRERAVTEKPRR
jgi:hypothetical protein